MSTKQCSEEEGLEEVDRSGDKDDQLKPAAVEGKIQSHVIRPRALPRHCPNAAIYCFSNIIVVLSDLTMMEAKRNIPRYMSQSSGRQI